MILPADKLNASDTGHIIQTEAVIVKDGFINLGHDNFFDLKIYSDLNKTIQLTDGLDYSQGGFDSELNAYNFISFTGYLPHLNETVYADYKSKGDNIEAEDINSRAYAFMFFSAGETIHCHRAVYLNNGKVFQASNTDNTIPSRIIGISLQSAETGESVKIAINGFIFDSSWNWNPDKNIFIGENGALVQNTPASGFLKIIAVPVDSNALMIINSKSIRLTEV